MYREDTKSYRISFANSIENPKFMEKYGFKPRKTYNPIDFFVFKDYDKELLLALLIGIIDGDGSIQPNGSSNAFCITITAHGPNSIRNLWRRLIFQSTYQIGKVLQL